jgi:hypothetical protein
MNLIKLDLISDVGLSPGSDTEKNRLISLSSEVTEVTTADQQQVAVRCGKQIKQLLNEVETARTQVKEPVLDLGRKIDGLAKTYCIPLQAEIIRLTNLVTGFQRLETERLRKEEEKRQEALRKAEEDRLAAEQLSREAEKQATSDQAGLSEVEEAMLAEELKKEAEAKQEALVRAPLPKANKVSGIVVKADQLQYEITDIHALYAVRPDLVELTGKRSIIRDNLDFLWYEQQNNKPTPGLRVWTDTKVSFRG